MLGSTGTGGVFFRMLDKGCFTGTCNRVLTARSPGYARQAWPPLVLLWASDCHAVVLCFHGGRPLQPKCIAHTSLYSPVAAAHARECDRLFRFDEFVVLETQLSSCV